MIPNIPFPQKVFKQKPTTRKKKKKTTTQKHTHQANMIAQITRPFINKFEIETLNH
jgi:hypothetical protein